MPSHGVADEVAQLGQRGSLIRYHRGMGTILALIFIGVTAVTGIAVGLRPTIADGRLIADALVKRNAGTSLTSVECDREIRIAVDGATKAAIPPS